MSPKVFNRDVHGDKVVELPFYYSFNVGLDIPGSDVYQMLNIVEKNAAELAQTDPTFSTDRQGYERIPETGREILARSRCHPSRACEMDAREGGVGPEMGFQDRKAMML